MIVILEEAQAALDREQEWAYSDAWDKMLVAQNAYFDATAERLKVENVGPRWRMPWRRSRK